MKKIFAAALLSMFILSFISCKKMKGNEYVDPYAFTVNSTVPIKSNSVALAIAFNAKGGDPLQGTNYLIDISSDGKIDTVRFSNTDGVDVTDKLCMLFMQNINADYTLIGLARNSGAVNEAYLLNKKDKKLTSLTGNEIPAGMSGNGSPTKQFVINPNGTDCYYISRQTNLERLIKLTIGGTSYISSIISKDTMNVDDFAVDKNGNGWTSYSSSITSANDIIINAAGENISKGKQFPQRKYWVNANNAINYADGGVVYTCLYDINSNSLTYPAVITTPSPVSIPQGYFSNARYTDYLYTFASGTVLIDDKTSLTVLKNQAFNFVVSCDFAALSKQGFIAGENSTNVDALYSVTMKDKTVQITKVINEGVYSFTEIEMLEDGTVYFSGKRLSDGKTVLAKRDAAGTVTILSAVFAGTVEFIESTAEFTNRY